MNIQIATTTRGYRRLWMRRFLMLLAISLLLAEQVASAQEEKMFSSINDPPVYSNHRADTNEYKAMRYPSPVGPYSSVVDIERWIARLDDHLAALNERRTLALQWLTAAREIESLTNRVFEVPDYDIHPDPK